MSEPLLLSNGSLSMRQNGSENQDTRVAVLSVRNIDRHVSRSHAFEFEDAICDMEGADLFTPEAGTLHKTAIKGKNWASKKWASSELLPTGLKSVTLEKDYDVFFVSIASLRDLNFLSSVGNWRKNSKRAVVWIQELWLADLDRQSLLLAKLDQFDLVVCSFVETTKELRSRLQTDVMYLPWGIDGLKFCPLPNPPTRSIELLSVGAKNELTHEALLKHFQKTGDLYLYDTISGRSEMNDYIAHRNNFISQIQRSKYFFCYRAKIERVEERGDQLEFGLRYLEALAGGAVVLGEKIDSEAFQDHFGWSDAVIEVPYASTDIGETLRSLSAQSNRMNAISGRNSQECLLRHDHLNRWQLVIERLDMRQHRKMKDRRAKLFNLAKVISSGDGSTRGGTSYISSLAVAKSATQ